MSNLPVSSATELWEGEVAKRRRSWEPEWRTAVDRDYLHRLVGELDVVLAQRSFSRDEIYRLRVTRDDPVQSLDGVASWIRITDDSLTRNTMNGVACFGNGLIRIKLDQGNWLNLLTDGRSLPEAVAAGVAQFIDTTDAACQSRVAD